MRGLLVAVSLVVAGCASAPASTAPQPINAAAEQWVRLALEIDTHEEGYVDAYFGPADWREQARARPRTIEALKAAADTLGETLTSIAAADRDADARARARVMAVGVASARFRLDMLTGVRLPLPEEAERLFALRPELRPLDSYESILTRIETLAPGRGALADRVEAFRVRFAIPADRLEAVMSRAIEECRARTSARYTLPDNEAFTMEFVTGQSWSAYNWYQGGNQSLIQVNTDLPVTIDRALTLACHEGYPGHHVQGIYNERLYRERGWIEYAVAPLFHPAGPMNEGAGNYGVELAFPGNERLAFERDVLYPLAGLDPATAASYDALRRALADLAGARLTISAMYLDGDIDRDAAVAAIARYQLVSRERAEQSIRFTEHYRSYVINYVTGEDLVRAYVERAGPSADARWAAFERIMTTPTLPEDLRR